jgi:hypothetical protein
MSNIKIAVPALIAVFAALSVFKAVGTGEVRHDTTTISEPAAPTPYSADHARIPSEATASEPAPTF